MRKLWKRKNNEAPKPFRVPGPILSVRVQPSDMEFLRMVAASRGQTLSAYVRETLSAQRPDLANCMIESVEVINKITVEVPKSEYLDFKCDFLVDQEGR